MRRFLALAALLLSACLPPEISELSGNGGPNGSNPGTRHHPEGFASAIAHGPAAKLVAEDCRGCHGMELQGVGAAVSCDGCHAANWKEDCTFCHGGTESANGAPPRDVDGTTDAASLSFRAHTAHVTTGANHVAFDCNNCHAKPATALDQDHWFDTTPGVAEIDFTLGMSDTSVYLGASTCDTTCHGDGRGNLKTVDHTMPTPGCADCHSFKGRPAVELDTMSGFHRIHLETALGGTITCVECHGDVVDAAGNIVDPALHVDGAREVRFTTSNIVMNGLACEGTCHTQAHYATSYKWDGTGAHHPTGFAAEAVHGLEAKVQMQDCRTCHGANLTGGTSGVSCDTCHPSGWRTNCTFCHGGGATTGGAPPRDMDGQSAAATLSFKAHTAHVTQTNHPAYGCAQCHRTPVDALSAGHTFDGSKGVAEVLFSGGLSAMGTYNGNASCATLYCHGNGRAANGSYTDALPKPACNGCHPFLNSGATAWGTMSGDHRRHLGESGVTCYDCHGGVVNSGNAIASATLHVNGARNTLFPTSNVTFANNRCNGTCHGESHNGDSW